MYCTHPQSPNAISMPPHQYQCPVHGASDLWGQYIYHQSAHGLAGSYFKVSDIGIFFQRYNSDYFYRPLAMSAVCYLSSIYCVCSAGPCLLLLHPCHPPHPSNILCQDNSYPLSTYAWPPPPWLVTGFSSTQILFK